MYQMVVRRCVHEAELLADDTGEHSLQDKLSTYDRSITMGAADAALETTDIALMAAGLKRLPDLYKLSTTASGVIRQNIWSSLGVKLLLGVDAPLGYVSVLMAIVIGDMG